MLKTNCILFLAGGCGYPLLELAWRGHTHYSMAIAGGLCMCAIHEVCNKRLKHRPLFFKCLAGAGIITGIELLTGLVVNEWLDMRVWDYSRLPLNILGQICLPFSVLWAFLTIPAMGLGTLCSMQEKK